MVGTWDRMTISMLLEGGYGPGCAEESWLLGGGSWDWTRLDSNVDVVVKGLLSRFSCCFCDSMR